LKLRLAFVAFLGAAAAAGWWWWHTRLPADVAPTSGTNIVAFGDSLVEGVGASPGQDFVSLLASRTGHPIINAGHRGDTTRDALDRLGPDVLSRDPRVVIVLVGGNDFIRRVPRETTFDNLSSIVTTIRRRGAAVILVGVSLGLVIDNYGDGYEAIAERTHSVLVPDVLDGILGHGDLTADQIHPNDRGYAIVANRIEPVLRRLIQ